MRHSIHKNSTFDKGSVQRECFLYLLLWHDIFPNIFDRNKPEYEKALQRSSHRTKLQYQPTKTHTPEAPTQQNKRHRNIMWFNLQNSAHGKTNIGKKFLKLIVALPPKPWTAQNLQQKHHQTELQLHGQHGQDNKRTQQRINQTKREQKKHLTHDQHFQNQIYCPQIKLHELRQGKQHWIQQIHLETNGQTDTLPNNLENTSTSTALFTNNKTLQSLPLGKNITS